MEFGQHLDRLRDEYEPWLSFGRFIIGLKIDELKEKIGINSQNEVIDGSLVVPETLDARAHGLLKTLLCDSADGEAQLVSFAFTETGLTLFSLSGGIIHIDPNREGGEVLQTGRYNREVYLEDATSFTLFKTACNIIDCLSDNLQVKPSVGSAVN